jgi:dTDP-4-amino-4,6-dideoxygalactose transaminase
MTTDVRRGAARLAIRGGPPVVTRPAPEAWPSFSEADVQAVARQVRSGRVAFDTDEGPVRALEERARGYFGARHVLAVSSGTAALHAALFALGVTRGQSVLCPTYTFVRTATPVLHLGARVIPVDSQPDLENVDADRLAASLAPDTVGILVTHWNGHPVDLAPVHALARARGLWVVEDAAHAHGARYRDSPVGAGRSDAVCFSLHGRKLVPAGQGGLLCTPRTDVYERAMLLCYFRPRLAADVADPALSAFTHSGLGLNYQLNPLAALLAHAGFDRLDDVVAAREANCRILDAALDGLPEIRPPARRGYATRHTRYAYRPRYRAAVDAGAYCAALRAEGVPIRTKHDVLLHEEPVLCGRWPALPGAASGGAFPNASLLRRQSLDLDVPHTLRPDLMEQYATAFTKVSENLDALP